MIRTATRPLSDSADAEAPAKTVSTDGRPGPANRRLRVALIADGDLDSLRTNSGSARALARALSDNPAVELIPLVGRLPTWLRVGLAATHVRPSRQAWRRAVVKSRMAVIAQSRMRDAQLKRLAVAPDIVLHHRNLYLPCQLPYACFVDTTAALSQAGWEAWRLPPRLAAWRASTERRYLAGAVRVLTAGDGCARSAVEDASAPADRVTVIGAGTNPMPPPLVDVPRRPHDIVFVGVEWLRKGGDVLLAAWPAVIAAVPDAVLHLVGSGPARASAPRDATGIVSHGRIGRGELSAVLAGASIFCLPALFDPHPLAVQEGMGAGLAVVVSDIGDLPARVDGAGIAVPAGDAAALAGALVRLLTDTGLRERCAAGGRAAAATMTWSAVAARIVTALTEGLRQPADTADNADNGGGPTG